MDIKVGGITTEVMRKALDQARRGRLHILEKMQEALAASRQNISNFAPRIVTIRIPVDKIRDVIGPGGKMIRSIIERTGVKIDVEDDGRVNVASADGESAQKAISIIQELTATPELNKTYLGKVQRITDFGAFVEIMPGTDGLLHVSEIANHRVKDVRDELKEGEQILGQGDQHRSDRQDSPQPQGAAAGRRRAAAPAAYNKPSGRTLVVQSRMRRRDVAHRRRISLFAGTLAAARPGQDQGPGLPQPFPVAARRYAFEPRRIEVEQDDLVKIELRTVDIAHSLTIDAYRIAKRVSPGAAGDVRVPGRPGRHVPLLLQPQDRRRLPPDARRAGRASRDARSSGHLVIWSSS